MGIQEKIAEIIAQTNDEKWNRYSRIYLCNASGTVGKEIERDTLTKIAASSTPGSDKAIIRIVAEDEVNSSNEDTSRRIKLFLLQHRSQYNPGVNEEYLNGSLEISNSSSAEYKARAELCGLTAVPHPSLETQGYKIIGTDQGVDVYHLAEFGKLYGREQPIGFATSISTAACVHNGITNQFISYDGYFFEGGGVIPDITGNGNIRVLDYIVYTPGGGPISEQNWIIKVVESTLTVFVGSDIYLPYTVQSGDSTWIIKKTYIHFFKHNGSYVRRSIDRTDMVKNSNLNDLDIWMYEDYQNPQAILNDENFAKIWNSCYGSGNNKPYGAPAARDYSLFWNQGIPGKQPNGAAYNGSNSWNGQEA